MSDKKEQEEKGEKSDTDYGSDTWLADFYVDEFIQNWKAVEKHNCQYDRNPYYRIQFDGGKRAQKRERMLEESETGGQEKDGDNEKRRREEET